MTLLPRIFRTRLVCRALPCLLWLLVATSLGPMAVPEAEAAPVFVTFNGDFMGQTWGIGEPSVTNAMLAGVPLVTLRADMIGEALVDSMGPFAIGQSLMTVPPIDATPADPMANPVTATSDWTATNVSMAELSDTHFLIWSRVVEDFPFPGAFDPDNVAIAIDRDVGWILAQTFVMGSRIVYPALTIEGLGTGLAHDFEINYRVQQQLPFFENAYYLPQFQLNKAGPGSVIPEPATAALLGVGLLGLAAKRRRAL